MKAQLVATCVESKGHEITAMMDKAREINRETFFRNTEWKPVAEALGYHVGPGRGLCLRGDYHPRYYRSQWRGRRCYVMVWSAIEHIFTGGES